MIKLQGEEGYHYVLQIDVGWKTSLGSDTIQHSHTTSFEVLFPVRSVDGLLDLLSQEGGDRD